MLEEPSVHFDGLNLFVTRRKGRVNVHMASHSSVGSLESKGNGIESLEFVGGGADDRGVRNEASLPVIFETK